jgi:hypothetical protein
MSDLKGRKVEFQVSTGRITGTVIYGPPRATGDAWIIADQQRPPLQIYVQTYEYMLLFPEKRGQGNE